MPEFNLGNLDAWEGIEIGEVVGFDVPPASYRNVRFDVMADAMVSVRVLTKDRYWIVAAGFGRLGCRFAMDEDFGVVVNGPKGANVFLRAGRLLPILPESLNPSHTIVEPRRAGPTDELRRMMHMVRLNSERRERHLLDEIRRLGRPAPAPVVAGAPAGSTPAPAPAATPLPAAGDPKP